VGIDGETKYESFRPEIPAGARLVLLTDGILEAENERGRPFGMRRLSKAAVLGARLPVDEHRDSLLEAGAEYRGSVPPDDDVTVVVVQLP
jgi:serine phosphatase RsbU (regulator of sigma subunit)